MPVRISDPRGGYFIGEAPIYPGHPSTCALIILRAYAGNVSAAWGRSEHGWLVCEEQVQVPTAGGNLSSGCDLIRYVLEGALTIDGAFGWADRTWASSEAGGHPNQVAPGQEQAQRLRAALRTELQRLQEAAKPVE